MSATKATVFGKAAADEQIRAEFEALKAKHDLLGDEMKQCEIDLLALLTRKYGTPISR